MDFVGFVIAFSEIKLGILIASQWAQAADPCHHHHHTWNGGYAGWPSLIATLYLLLLGHASFPLKLMLFVYLSLESFSQC